MRNYLKNKFPFISRVKQSLLHKHRNGAFTLNFKFLRLTKQISAENNTLLTQRDMWNLYRLIRKTRNINGHISEVGVWSGGSAKMLATLKNDHQILYLFDTFKGIPENKGIDNLKAGFAKGDSLEEVKKYLVDFENILFYEGKFPESAKDIETKFLKFSFIHLDTDIYEATFDSLKYFYPMVATGGIILTHDYDVDWGVEVKKAFDDFFRDKPEKILKCWKTSQAYIIKI